MRDIAGNSTTTGRLSLGATLVGTIETPFDEDWYRIELRAGQDITLTLRGAGSDALADPILDLYDGAGALLALNLNAGGGTLNAQITFTPERSGSYFVGAYAAGPITGSYTLTAAALAGTPVEAILWGSQVPDNEISVYFAENGVVVDGITSEGWTAYETARAMAAFALIEAVTPLSFAPVRSAAEADFILGLDTDELNALSVLGYLVPPGEPGAGRGSLNGAKWDRGAGGNLEPGGSGFTVLTHEILHGLGLAHPHDSGGGSAVMQGVSHSFGDYGTGRLNQGIYTTMSYNAGWHEGTVGIWGALDGSWGREAGPMALDIAALQAIYGANMATATGDDVYVLPDRNETGTAWQAIWDAGGNDTIRYDGLRDTAIDLRAATLRYEEGGGGFLSAARSVAGGFTIASGVVIEAASSGSGNDLIQGNDADNLLFAGRGNDTVLGGGGNDRITAHRGQDVLTGGDGDDWISAGRGNDAIRGNTGNDTLLAGRGNDLILGQAGDDLIIGRKGRDVIRGGAGDDRIHAGSGNDTVFGGPGDDMVTLGFGQDTFVFRAGDGADVVTDFNPGRDRLRLDPDLMPSGTSAEAVWRPEGILLRFDGGDSILFLGLDRFDLPDPAVWFDPTLL